MNRTTDTFQFIEEQPDWSRRVLLEASYKTPILSARTAREQRGARLRKPKLALAYTIAAMNLAEFTVRRMKSLLEQQATVVVPVWPDAYTLVSLAGGTAADLGQPLAKKRFKVGSYAYFLQGGVSEFRAITAISGNTLTVAAGSQTFTAGAEVWPCIVGVQREGSAFLFALTTEAEENIAVEEL